MPWQEQWIHPQAYAYRRNQSSTDATLLIGTMLEHARIMSKSIAGAATDYAKCFDLIPQQISLEVAKKKGIYPGIITAMAGMHKDLRRAFKVNGCLGSYFEATNGILQGCAVSSIFINVLMTIWMKQVDDMGNGYEVQVRDLPPRPRDSDEVRNREPDTRPRALAVV